MTSNYPHRPRETPIQALAGEHWSSTAASARSKFRRACPRLDNREELAEHAYRDAVSLTHLVREEDPMVVFGALSFYTHAQLSVLVVALAAMVPTDRSASDLLGWLNTSEVA